MTRPRHDTHLLRPCTAWATVIASFMISYLCYEQCRLRLQYFTSKPANFLFANFFTYLCDKENMEYIRFIFQR